MKIGTIALATGLLAGLPHLGGAQVGGQLDTRFGDQGSFRLDRAPYNEGALDLALDSQGRLYVAFSWRDAAADPTWWPGLLRLTAAGNLDPAFGAGGVWIGLSAPVAAGGVRVAVDAADRPLLGWTYDADPSAGENFAWTVRRLHLDGSFDVDASVQFNWGASLLEQL